LRIGEGEIFGVEWEQLAFDRRRMYNEKLYDLHYSPRIVWRSNTE
jgi:hypothetical protein